MHVSIDQRWEVLVKSLLKDGSYASADEIVSAGLEFVEERQIKLAALREMIDGSIARGGSNSSEEVKRRVQEALEGQALARARQA